jgi:hypothetical protein
VLNENRKIVKVVSYSGYKNDETPRAVWVDDREYQVREVLWRKRVRDLESGQTVEAFRVKIDGEIITIEKSESGEWSAKGFIGRQS